MMTLSLLISMATAAAGAGVTCGVTCGACGSPLTNIFLSSYLFTHSGKLRRSILSFFAFFIGKTASVIILRAVLRRAALTQHTRRRAYDRGLVPPYKFAERFGFSRERERHKPPVRCSVVLFRAFRLPDVVM
ncbi:MAG: hypothetical protein LBS90_03590 [Oscillospiraceae bacterium]|nr:hypothetical protein [Oscillospiraceae bacterium]